MDAWRTLPPMVRASCGVPVIVTWRLKVTNTCNRSPVVWLPSKLAEPSSKVMATPDGLGALAAATVMLNDSCAVSPSASVAVQV